MIRGAFILAVGYSLGYAHALKQSDQITELLQKLVKDVENYTATSTPPAAEAEEEIIEAVEVPEKQPESETQD